MAEPPTADPAAILACLPPEVAAEFEKDWTATLDEVKQSKNLTVLHAMLTKWVQFAAAEQRDPGSYFRVLAAASRTEATGQAPAGSMSGTDVLAMLLDDQALDPEDSKS